MSMRLLAVVCALVLAAGQASAAGRSSVSKFGFKAITSISGAAKAAPAASAAIDDETTARNAAREKRQREMIDKLASGRRSKMSAALKAAAPKALPKVAGLRLSDEDNGMGFRGISNVDQSSVNYGFSVEPPDQALCAGNGFVFEGVNAAFAVYSEKGALLAGPAQANAFMGVDFSLNVSDPKCLYDRASDRWFVTMVEYNNDLTQSAVLIAVSASGDPTGAFLVYGLDVTNDGSDFFPGDCPCLGDQPLIGADANGFYISTNAFGFFSYQGAQVYAISKSALAAGAKTVPVVHFDQLSYLLPDIEFSFSIQPAFSPPGAKPEAGTEYLAQSMRAMQLENRLAVWAIGNTAAIDSDPAKLTLDVSVIPTQSYAQPVPAMQKAGPTPLAQRAEINDFAQGTANLQNLDGNDQRMSQVMYLGGQLWTAVGTASYGDGTPVRDGVAWFVLNVSNTAKAGLKAGVAAQGYIAGPDTSHLIYPAMAVNSDGQASMVFTLTGPQFFPSAAFWNFGSNQIHMLSDGAAAQDGFSAYYYARPRWGDYSAAAVGPDGSIWMATEMVPGGPRRLSANWGTFIGKSRRGERDDD